MALAMFSTAMRRKPSASPQGLALRPSAAISRASASNFSRTTSASSGSSAFGPNTAWEMPRLQLAEHDVAVGHRQRTAAAIAGGAGIGAGAFGADLEAAIAKNRIDPPPAATV
jgi:hypothetical protein